MRPTIVLCLLSYVLRVRAARDGICPPLGPVLPAPTHPSSSKTVEAAVSSIKDFLSLATSKLNGSAVAVGVKSIHEPEMLFNFSYTPPKRDPQSVQVVNSDTVFRLASVSKLFPVLALLMLEVHLEDPISKYLPELRDLNNQAREENAIWTIDWDEVTIGSLSSHLAGIGSDLATDLQPYGDFTQFGFPPEDPARNLNCSGFFGTEPCDWDVFDERFGGRPPIYLPFGPNAVYSNVAWALLGRAIERVTGMPSDQYIREKIWEPTGMKTTFASKPDESLGFIPLADTDWNATLGFESPAGAYYSTINDLTTFGDAILKNKLLSPAKTRKWLKPVTGTSSAGMLIGQPWEIFRTTNITMDGRIVDFYTKGGDLFQHHTLLALIPDYDLVLTILVAGPEVNGLVVQQLFSDIAAKLLPSVEAAGKEESGSIYEGTYSDPATNSSITLSLDDGPGFSIANWVVRGVNVIDTLTSLNLQPPVEAKPSPGLVRIRLYPTNIGTESQSSWRAVPAAGSAEEIEQGESQLVWPGGLCLTWAQMDRTVYQLLAQDHIVFTTSKEGDSDVATELELVGYRATLKREE